MDYSKPVELEVGGIPAVITDDHNEVLPYWLGQRDAVLFHIDAHPDTSEGAYYHGELTKENSAKFGIAGFICPAVHHGLISSIYWLNPLSGRNGRLIDLGTNKPSFGRRELGTKVVVGRYYWENMSASGKPEFGLRLNGGYGREINRRKIEIDGPLILDIDLDGFSCDRPESFYFKDMYNKDTMFNYAKRIERTGKLLKKLSRPEVITITRSQGHGIKRNRYVPLSTIDDVQSKTLEMLVGVYTK